MSTTLPDAFCSQKRVLIVDDSKAIRTLFKILVKRFDVRVEFAQDGGRAIECINREKPDLILLEILMPRVNGIEVLQYLNENRETRNIPRILISVLASVDSLKELMNEGVSTFLP